MKKITLKIFSLMMLTVFTVSGQEKMKLNTQVPDHRNCGLDKHYEAMANNPAYATSFYERKARFEEKLVEIHEQKMNGTYQRMATLYIPVAVHFEVGTEADRACLEAYAQTQIDVINEDYTATNADISNWAAASGFYPGLVPGSVDVQFCIATKNHPAGADPEVLEGSPLVTIGANGSSFGAGFPESDPTYAGYMNFIIKDIGPGLLGYSPLGGSISGGMAVVMNTNCYGTGSGCAGIASPVAPYNLGRTVTHELGHFYNLNHTFIADGDNTQCGQPDGDGIADTPKVSSSTYGNPANGSVAGCVGGEFSLTMNYMDYVNDASMYMFTPDQATVVDAYFASVSGDFAVDKIDCQGPTFNMMANDLGNCGADTAQTVVDFTVLNGFNEVTTFSVTGLPAGAIASFSPTTLSADGTTTLTVSGLNSVTDGTYPLQIVGTSSTVTKNLSIDLVDGTNVCAVSATTPWLTSITNVTFNTINNTTSSPDGSGAENGGYSDLTGSISTDVNIDESYPLSIKVDPDGQYRTQTKVWIDWNQNCVFDPSEEYDMGSADVSGTAPYFDIATDNSPFSVTVPSNAVLGNTVMRVATIYSDPNPPYNFPTACGVNDDGEVEDYTINVLAPLSVAENQFNVFGVYPNPSNGEITLTLSTNDDVTVSLFDIRGRKVYSQLHNNTSDSFTKKVDFSSMASGVYMLDVQSGSKRAIKKLVIQ